MHTESQKMLPKERTGESRAERVQLSEEEILKRVEEFAEKRKERLIAAVRKGKD